MPGIHDAEQLERIMEFDHVIRVNNDGTVADQPGIYAPELFDDELHDDSWELEWELLNGYSGQYGYGGPLMHSSEFIGGRMADDILSTPGIYVALVNYCDDDAVEWAVARKI